MSTTTSTLTAQLVTDWSDYTHIKFEITDQAGEWVDTIDGSTTAYTWIEIEGVNEVDDFDNQQFVNDLEATLKEAGYQVIDWTGENPDGTGAIIGAVVTKASA